MNEGDDSQIEYIVCIQQFLLTLDTKDFSKPAWAYDDSTPRSHHLPHFLDNNYINSIVRENEIFGVCDVSKYISYVFRDGYAKGLAVHGFISVLLNSLYRFRECFHTLLSALNFRDQQ